MPFDPDNLAAFFTEIDLNPNAYFIDHAGRARPLVVRHADGQPTYVVEDDGTLTPYVSTPNSDAPAVTAEYTPEADDATSAIT